jgi:hypothetical protein
LQVSLKIPEFSQIFTTVISAVSRISTNRVLILVVPDAIARN